MNLLKEQTIVFLGATGAVGSVALNHLLSFSNVNILSLGRKKLNVASEKLEQQLIDIHDPTSYSDYINNYKIAICTLGVGEPSKISKDDFFAIDKIAVLNFAKICKASGVKHFQLLSSIEL